MRLNKNQFIGSLIFLVLPALLIAGVFYFHNLPHALALEPVVYVDDDFNAGNAGGHTWGVDAFSTVPNGIAAVAVDGTVNVAAGTYITGAPITLNKRFSLIGPGKDAPIPALIVNNACGRVLNVSTTGLVVRGLHFKESNSGGDLCAGLPVVRITGAGGQVVTNVTFDDNELMGGTNALSVRFDARDVTISHNRIHNSDEFGLNMASLKDSEVFGNEIFDNPNGALLQPGRQSGDAPSGLDDGQFTGTIIYNNNFHNNSIGMDFEISDQASQLIIGPDNRFTDNLLYGLNFQRSSRNILVKDNHIVDNDLAGVGISGLAVNSLNNIEKNYWGSNTGPFHDTLNPAGTGNGFDIHNDADIVFRPYYTDAAMTNLSAVTAAADDLSLLYENGGTIYFEGTSLAAASEIEVNEDLTLTVASDNGTSSIQLAEETEITESNDNLFDGTQLGASNIPLDSLSGFVDENPVVNALQWGVPNVELTFSEPVTINLFLADEYNDRILVVKRSTTGTGDWTTDGIEGDFATCTVTNGVCTFHTTKASYFVALEPVAEPFFFPPPVSSGVSHRSSSGNVPEFLALPPATSGGLGSPSGQLQSNYRLFGLKYNDRSQDVEQLQIKLKDIGFFPRWVKPTGWFGPITQKAVQDFQRAFNLSLTGFVDQQTWYFWMTFFD